MFIHIYSLSITSKELEIFNIPRRIELSSSNNELYWPIENGSFVELLIISIYLSNPFFNISHCFLPSRKSISSNSWIAFEDILKHWDIKSNASFWLSSLVSSKNRSWHILRMPSWQMATPLSTLKDWNNFSPLLKDISDNSEF